MSDLFRNADSPHIAPAAFAHKPDFRTNPPLSGNRQSLLFSVTVGLVVLAWLYPFWLILQTSLKSDTNIRSSPFSPALPPMLDAYIHAWTALDMPHLLKNSLLLASGGVLVSLVIAFPISFLVARRRILFANGLFIFFLVGLMVPQQMVILPLYRIADSLRLSGTLLGLIAVHGVYGIPFAMLILRSYFANIPESLDEAARIDGCGDFGVLLRIVAPLSIPGLSTVAALQFMNIWNEFLFSVVLLTDSNDWPVTVGVLPVMLSQYFVSWNLPAATLVIAQLPTILIFVLGQRWVVKGITAGAVRD